MQRSMSRLLISGIFVCSHCLINQADGKKLSVIDFVATVTEFQVRICIPVVTSIYDHQAGKQVGTTQELPVKR